MKIPFGSVERLSLMSCAVAQFQREHPLPCRKARSGNDSIAPPPNLREGPGMAVPISSFVRGAFFILLAMFLFDLMGAIVKYMGSDYPAQQLAMFRNVFGLVPSVLILLWSSEWHKAGRPLIIRQWKLGLLRGAFIALAQYSFYQALINLEFATASTLAFAGPMFVTALSVLVLKEKVGLWRWMAVGIGFAGIVMIMQPGSDVFTLYAILPVGAAFCYASTSIIVKLFDDDVPTPTINLYTALAALFWSVIVVVATDGYRVVETGEDWLLLIAMGGVGGVAVMCLITAYRATQAANLAPFEYFGIPFSFVLGWFVFGEAPVDRLFPGALLIAGGGLLIVWRQRKNNQKIISPAPVGDKPPVG